MDQRYLIQPKTGYDFTRCYPKKDKILKHAYTLKMLAFCNPKLSITWKPPMLGNIFILNLHGIFTPTVWIVHILAKQLRLSIF